MTLINEDNLKKRFSKSLKYMMQLNNVSETLLSEETQISQSAVNRIKNGYVSPNLYQSFKIASYFKLSLDEFLELGKTISANEGDEFIPIINSHQLLLNNISSIEGFCNAEAGTSETIGFKSDHSFECSLFKKGTILLVQTVSQNLKKCQNGSTVLYVENKKFKVGSYSNHIIRPLDNLTAMVTKNDIKLVGTIIKIETNYICEKKLVDKIIKTIGELKLKELVDTRLAFFS